MENNKLEKTVEKIQQLENQTKGQKSGRIKLKDKKRRKNIPKTNNLLEGFFKITFPKKCKRRFRTEKGVKNYLRHMRIRGYERNVLHEKITI